MSTANGPLKTLSGGRGGDGQRKGRDREAERMLCSPELGNATCLPAVDDHVPIIILTTTTTTIITAATQPPAPEVSRTLLMTCPGDSTPANSL